jgi:hypothetical protein
LENNKKKYAYWMKPSMVEEIEASLELADVKSKSEFVCQAVSFYLGYLNQNKSVNYLAPLLMNAMKSEIRSSTKFICETLFKLAVEQAINSNYLANLCEADAETAERLREACARTVAENNGILTMEDAARWQNG